MTAERDDDALSWAGDKDPSLVPGVSPAEPELPEGWSVAGPKSTVEAHSGATDASAPVVAEPGSAAPRNAAVRAPVPPTEPAPSSFSLIAVGVLTGIYLLYTIGWFIGVTRIGNPLSDPVAQFMFSLGSWLAVAAPVIWFAAVYWLTKARLRARVVWLLIGVVVLAPLPFIVGVGGIS